MSREEKMAGHYRAMFRDYPDALSPQQVCKMLGIGQRLTYELLRGGGLPSVRMGKLYRVPKVAVIDYLCNNTQNT